MKLNISNPVLGTQKVFEIEDEHALLPFYEKRMGAEVEGDSLGEQFKGYLFKISGGNDKQGFPMMQGVLKNQRVRLLFKDGMPCYRERRGGMRKRKSVRGCIVGHDLAIMNLVIVKEGESPLEGLTDKDVAEKRLGPKRASKLKKLFDLSKEDDVRAYVIRRSVKDGKNKKAPKIQRLVTKVTLQRKRRFRNHRVAQVQKNRAEKKAYVDKMHAFKVEMKEKRHAELSKKKGKKATSA